MAVTATRLATTIRTDRILDAAEQLLLEVGLRGATMEAIARAAGVAKPTLYRYFPDKELVFAAIVSRLVARIRAIADNALTGPGSATERAAKALAGKHKLIFRLLEGSPHAAELYAAPKRSNRSELEKFDDWLQREIADAFSAEAIADPDKLARILFAAADGIAKHARHAEEIGPAIRLLAERLTAAPAV